MQIVSTTVINRSDSVRFTDVKSPRKSKRRGSKPTDNQSRLSPDAYLLLNKNGQEDFESTKEPSKI